MDTLTATTPEANQLVKWKAHKKLKNEDTITVIQAAIQLIPSEYLLELKANKYYNTHDLAI